MQVRRLEPGELGVSVAPTAETGTDRLTDRGVLVLVGLTGAGKTTTVERLVASLALAAILPDRRALTDSFILPLMAGGTAPVADRVERFRLTAAFKERYPGGMGEVLSWLLLPPGLPPGPVLFDGLRGEAEVAAAASLPRVRFLVLDCPPEGRLWRLCGRNDPFDQANVAPIDDASVSGTASMRAVLVDAGFSTLVKTDVFDRLAWMLANRGVDRVVVARSAAIIVEESRYYDPDRARDVLQRLAPERTLLLDTGTLGPADVAATVADWLADG